VTPVVAVPVVAVPVVPVAPVVAEAAPPATDGVIENAVAAEPVTDLAAGAPAAVDGLVPAPAAAPPSGLLPVTRQVLATPAARSIAAVLAIALAVLLFLAVQGRVDRVEPKLADGGDGRDLARFR
jgi:hypothetical protein